MDHEIGNRSPEAEELQALSGHVRSLDRKYAELQARCDRLLVHQELLDNRLLKIETNRLFRVWNKVVRTGVQLFDRASRPFIRMKRNARLRGSRDSYARWVSQEQIELLDRSRRVSHRIHPPISVVMVLRSWERETAESSLQSVLAQAYPDFELCIACLREPKSFASDFLSRSGAPNEAVHFALIPEDAGTATAINAAAALARGEYLLFFDPRDLLSPFALQEVVTALQTRPSDVLYSDEDELDPKDQRVSPIFKPDWSTDLLTSCMYIGSLFVVRRNLFLESGGANAESEGAEFYDLALRLTEVADGICHIPHVLHHRRRPKENRLGDAEVRAIERAMERRGWPAARVDSSGSAAPYLVTRGTPQDGSPTVVICSRNRKLLGECLKSIRASSGDIDCEIVVVHHTDGRSDDELTRITKAFGCKTVPFAGVFNFSTMNNLGAEHATRPYLLFLNDDVRAQSRNWASHLLGHLQRPDIGIVGATLYYPSGTLQHAGIVLGIGDGVGHVGRFHLGSDWWPWLMMTRNVSAVTGAFLGIRTEVFRELGGFDCAFGTNYNDVDLCLRARTAGYSVLCMAEPGLVHEECQTRQGLTRLSERELFYARWGHLLAQGDPFYSPNLSPTEQIDLRSDQQERAFDLLRRPIE